MMIMNRGILLIIPFFLMPALAIGMTGIEHWMSAFGNSEKAWLALGRIGIAAPYVSSAGLGIVYLLACNGARNIRYAGWGVVAGSLAVVSIAIIREGTRLAGFRVQAPSSRNVLSYADPATLVAVACVLLAGAVALRVAIKGNAAFASAEPKRIRGKRAMHGEADWMKMPEAAKLFGAAGGIVVGENYRVDRDSTAAISFRADQPDSWGRGGKRRCSASTARLARRMASSLPVPAASRRHLSPCRRR